MKLLKVKTQPAPEQSRFDVFISYSRDDDAFVRRLYDALNEKERRAWVDWKGIPPTADWMAARPKPLGDTDGASVREGEEASGVFRGAISRDFVFSAIICAPFSPVVRSGHGIA